VGIDMQNYLKILTLIFVAWLASCTSPTPVPVSIPGFVYIPDFAVSKAKFAINPGIKNPVQWTLAPQIGDLTPTPLNYASTTAIYAAPKVNILTQVAFSATNGSEKFSKVITIIPSEANGIDANTDSTSVKYVFNPYIVNPHTVPFNGNNLVWGRTYRVGNKDTLSIFLIDENNQIVSGFGLNGYFDIEIPPNAAANNYYKVFVSNSSSIFAYIFDPLAERVLKIFKFNSSGVKLTEFGQNGELTINFPNYQPRIDLGDGENVLVQKSDQEIEFFDGKLGKLISDFAENGTLRVPTDYAIKSAAQAKTGEVTVATRKINGFYTEGIFRYSPDGKIEKKWGKEGRIDILDGQFASREFKIKNNEDGSILVFGSTGFFQDFNTFESSPGTFVASIDADGVLDRNFFDDGIVFIQNSFRLRFGSYFLNLVKRANGDLLVLNQGSGYVLDSKKKVVRSVDLEFDALRTIGPLRLDQGEFSDLKPDGSFTMYANLCVFIDQNPASCNGRNAIIKGKLF
jgi:hypothetical protein